MLLAGIVLFRAVISGAQITAGQLASTMRWSAFAGGIAGLVYGVVAAPLRARGRLGAYLAGIVTAAGYAAALILVVLPALGEPPYGAAVNWLAGIGISLVAGAALGSEFAKEAE